MQERVQALGGEFAIETGSHQTASGPAGNGGTCVRIVIPLPSRPAGSALSDSAQPGDCASGDAGFDLQADAAAGLVPAARNLEAQSRNNRGGRRIMSGGDTPGHDTADHQEVP
jgi:hypothetical protein